MMGEPGTRIQAFLGRCRRRLLRTEFLAGTAVVASVVLATLVAAVGYAVLAGGLGAARGVLLTLLVAGVLAAAAAYLVRPRLRWRPGVPLAREIERRLGGRIGSLELVGAMQLHQKLAHPPVFANTSPALVEAHLETVAARLEGVEPAQVVPAARLRRPLGVLAGLGVLTGLLVLLAPGPLGEAAAALVRAQRSPSEAAARQTSWVGDIRLTYRYPDYSGREMRTVEGTDGTILALPGTRVTVTSRADRDIVHGSLEMGSGKRPLEIAGGRTLEGELVVTKPGEYRFMLEDDRGRRWVEPRPHPVRIEVDRAPRVKLEKPERDLVVRERDQVDILYDVRDDFGIGEVRLVWRIAGRPGEVHHKRIGRNHQGGRRSDRHAFRWDLANLELRPGDRLQFTIEADDNDTVLGPKTGRSRTRTLQVFSAAEHHRKLVEQAQALWEQLLALLAGSAKQHPDASGGPSAGVEPKAYRTIRDRTADFLNAADGLIVALAQDELASAPLLDALDNIRSGLTRLQAELEHILRRAARYQETGQLARLIGAHRDRRIGRLERDVLYLEDLLDLLRLDDLDRIAKELADARDQLAGLMRDYAKAPDEQTRRRIENAIARLKKKIAELLARQREVLKTVRDEYLNPEALQKKLSEKDMLGALDRIQKLLMEGKVDEAMQELARLQQQLDELQEAIDRSRAEFGQGKYDELRRKLQELQAELHMVTREQRELTEATGALRDKMSERLKKLDRERLDRLFRKLRARLEKVVADVTSIPPQDLDRSLAEHVARARERAKLLDGALEALDPAASLEAARDLERAAAALALRLEGLHRFENRYNPRRAGRLGHHLKVAQRAQAGAEDIRKTLEDLMPRPSELLGKGDLQRLGQMSGQQASLRGKMRGLRQRMEEINQEAPLFGPQALQGMQRGGRHMDQAAGELGGHRPGGAHPHQQAALSELERMKQSMEQSCKKCGSGQPMPMGFGRGRAGGRDTGGMGGGMSQRDVEIPGPDDYRPPEAFREALLEGMKDPVPEDFEQQVRRYYEELVR